MRVLATTLAAVLAATALPARVSAAPEADARLASAMEHFEQGIALYEEGDYSAALFEFEKAYETKPDYRLLYNIGVTALELRDYVAARDALGRYLAEGGADIAAQRRVEVEGQLETLEGRIGTVTVDCAVNGARVTIDGEPVGTTPFEAPLVVNIGKHRVRVESDAHEPYETEVEVSVEESTQSPDDDSIPDDDVYVDDGQMHITIDISRHSDIDAGGIELSLTGGGEVLQLMRTTQLRPFKRYVLPHVARGQPHWDLNNGILDITFDLQ